MLRVAHLLDGRHFGGAEQMVRRLAIASKPIEVESRVYVLSEGRLSRALADDGTALRVFPSSGRFDFSPLRALAAALREDRIQIIQSHTSRTHLFARLLSRKVGIPNITTIHSPTALDENLGMNRHPLRAWVERVGRRWTDHICPVSREETERLIRDEGVPETKITCIPNGMDALDAISVHDARQAAPLEWLDAMGLPRDAFILAMVAALRPRKGCDVLIRAFAKFRATGVEGALLIVGDDEFTEGRGLISELKTLAASEGISDRIHFAGFQEDPWRLASCANAIALPSLFGEGLPLALIEAMNRARPILASDIPGNRECVEKDANGWLHPPGDVTALADQIGKAASDRAALIGMGERGKALFMERFEMTRVLALWRSAYGRCLGA